MIECGIMREPALHVNGGAARGVMRRFRFRFEAVKKQRSAMLDAAKGRLGEVMNRYNLAVELLAERRQALLTVAGATPSAGRTFDPARDLIRQRHLQALRDEIKRREHQLTLVERELQKMREEVGAAHRALKAIEVLEERDIEEWRQETIREEQQEADERNAQRFGRD